MKEYAKTNSCLITNFKNLFMNSKQIMMTKFKQIEFFYCLIKEIVKRLSNNLYRRTLGHIKIGKLHFRQTIIKFNNIMKQNESFVKKEFLPTFDSIYANRDKKGNLEIKENLSFTDLFIAKTILSSINNSPYRAKFNSSLRESSNYRYFLEILKQKIFIIHEREIIARKFIYDKVPHFYKTLKVLNAEKILYIEQLAQCFNDIPELKNKDIGDVFLSEFIETFINENQDLEYYREFFNTNFKDGNDEILEKFVNYFNKVKLFAENEIVVNQVINILKIEFEKTNSSHLVKLVNKEVAELATRVATAPKSRTLKEKYFNCLTEHVTSKYIKIVDDVSDKKAKKFVKKLFKELKKLSISISEELTVKEYLIEHLDNIIQRKPLFNKKSIQQDYISGYITFFYRKNNEIISEDESLDVIHKLYKFLKELPESERFILDKGLSISEDSSILENDELTVQVYLKEQLDYLLSNDPTYHNYHKILPLQDYLTSYLITKYKRNNKKINENETKSLVDKLFKEIESKTIEIGKLTVDEYLKAHLDRILRKDTSYQKTPSKAKAKRSYSTYLANNLNEHFKEKQLTHDTWNDNVSKKQIKNSRDKFNEIINKKNNKPSNLKQHLDNILLNEVIKNNPIGVKEKSQHSINEFNCEIEPFIDS